MVLVHSWNLARAGRRGNGKGDGGYASGSLTGWGGGEDGGNEGEVPSGILLGERLAALCFLVLFMWCLLLVSWLIAITGGSPVVVKDVVMSGGGEVGRSCGSGRRGGERGIQGDRRFLRRWGIDETLQAGPLCDLQEWAASAQRGSF